jgi:ROK family
MSGTSHPSTTTSPVPKAIGFDIGGTKIACGIVNAAGETIEGVHASRTPAGGTAETLHALLDTIHDLRARHSDITAIGVGAAGLVDWPDGHIRWAPNNDYHDMPLRTLLETASQLPTIVDNDANVAAWAEARLDNAPDHMIFLTVGTGVGGGLVLDGRLYRGRRHVRTHAAHGDPSLRHIRAATSSAAGTVRPGGSPVAGRPECPARRSWDGYPRPGRFGDRPAGREHNHARLAGLRPARPDPQSMECARPARE